MSHEVTATGSLRPRTISMFAFRRFAIPSIRNRARPQPNRSALVPCTWPAYWSPSPSIPFPRSINTRSVLLRSAPLHRPPLTPRHDVQTQLRQQMERRRRGVSQWGRPPPRYTYQQFKRPGQGGYPGRRFSKDWWYHHRFTIMGGATGVGCFVLYNIETVPASHYPYSADNSLVDRTMD